MENFCGKRLDGRYEIREIIGVGGMAVVYKAYDNIDDRIVAIKILKDEFLTNEDFKRRFKNESKAIAVLSHPNIVRVFNVSFGDRLQYIVMEYVDGITLKEYIEQQGVINWKEAVHFMGQILAALQHAHDKGIVHQDIKPQNIMLLQDGTIKVTDFGIARFSRTDSDNTSENAIGSVHYISPEQARGEMTDDKADIYSVGVVMYEMLTGKLPFQSDSAVSVALMQLQQDPKRPREIVPTIPLGLEQITIRAMQKNPYERYGSAAEMLMDINEFKRNPSVKFNYTYFVDKEPTKYVNSTANRSKSVQYANETQQPEAKSVNKTAAIMLGAIAGIVMLVVIIVSVFSALGNQKVEVPNFVNMNYYEEIQDNDEYEDFEFVIEFNENSTLDDGTVLEQTPSASEKVKKGTEIKLVIVEKNNVIIDKSILGMNEDEAKNYLTERGLSPVAMYEYSEKIEPGYIIRTSPDVGTSVRIGSKVTLYIATDVKETVKVPELEGIEKDMAIQLIKASDLVVGTITEVNSDLEAGVVVKQSIAKDETVPLGSKIDLEISNGIPAESSVEITVNLPNVNKTGILKIYINNEIYLTSNELYLDGAEKKFTLSGSGEVNSYVVMIDDSPIQKGKIDFTKVPAEVSNIENLPYETMAILPNNLVGKTKEEAIAQLNAAGFMNVEIIESPSAAIPSGEVISQAPVSDGVAKIPTSTVIKLTVSTGENFVE